ncbi:hypothetical protein [Lignipirellula cremea]|uniref:Peptidase C39 domain-containing protein n=1 Tax=Lignipirellula cremea TaxID=2528010 RepID=A0A518DTG5_9BACT|nr:hypothetical protein [Lignipirellula cremea]QDU95130.1 hypothetical protein Pla8534_29420 [Lignipirellula cremea]
MSRLSTAAPPALGRRLTIPYLAQERSPGVRACGAACLAMAYAALGRPEPAAEIWERIAAPDRRGRRFARTVQLARDAIRCGWSATILRPEDPFAALTGALEQGACVLANHRLSPGSPWGHFSVAIECRAGDIWLHDPLRGASLRQTTIAFDRCWAPLAEPGETIGHVLLAITPPEPGGLSDVCETCRQPIPLALVQQLRGLADGILFCPHCDTGWRLSPSA